MKLLHEVVSYTTKHGEVKEVVNYYVEVLGIKVQLRPVDYTGRELLEHGLKNKGKD